MAYAELPATHPHARTKLSDAGAHALSVAHRFSHEVLRPQGPHYDKNPVSDGGQFCWPVLAEAARRGIYTPDFFGALFTDPVAGAAVTEELFSGDAGLALAITYAALPAAAILASGTAEQIQSVIPRLFGTAEAPLVGCFVASEPDAGSDLSRVSTTAVRVGEQWVLNGTKRWGGNTGLANVYIVLASVDADLGARGQALFIIDEGTEGLSWDAPMGKLGVRATVQADLYLNDVRIPAESVLGGTAALQARLDAARARTSGTKQPAYAAFSMTRPMVGAMAVGVAQRALEEAASYAATRIVSGKPVAAHGAPAALLADAATAVESARALVGVAVRAMASGRDDRALGSMAKLHAARVACQVTDTAIQIHGGIGFTDRSVVESLARNARIFRIFEGTDEVQQMMISRAVSGCRPT
jgi:acyl-CoA dehydrogenase